VGQQHELRDFDVFSAKALAGIGDLPSTVGDRCIRLHLKRRRKDEPVARWRFKTAEADAAVLRAALVGWAAEAVPALRAMTPTVPDALHDRAAEVWEPLFAVADLAGGEWPNRARAAAVALHGQGESETDGVQLLGALREIFDTHGDRILTADLLSALVAREAEPWATWWGRDVQEKHTDAPASKLARLLRPFDIRSNTVRVGDARGKGYERSACEDAFARYLQPKGVTEGQPLSPNACHAERSRDTPLVVTPSDGVTSIEPQGLSPCHASEPECWTGGAVVACVCGASRWERRGPDQLVCLGCRAIACLDGRPFDEAKAR
jgi:hypothetical protein